MTALFRGFTALLVCAGAAVAGCAMTAPPSIQPLGEGPTPTPLSVAAVPAAPVPICTSFARPGVLRRSVLNHTIDRGLGHWLTGVEVDPGLQQGHFRGWIVRSLYPNDPCYREVDLAPGDLVVRVNGKSIERPEQADAVFNGLKTAPSLVVELIRDKLPRTLTLSIVEE